MLRTDPLEIFLRYDRWATERMFAAYRTLGETALDREFPIGLGTLRKTLLHVVANMEWWTDRAESRTLRPFRSFSADPPASLDSIIARYHAAWADIETSLATSDAAGRAEIIESDFDSPEGGVVTARFPRGGVLLHILNHGTHHRAQCLNMLRRLGVEPLPEIDLIDSNQEVSEPR